jgi:hypothetical protein
LQFDSIFSICSTNFQPIRFMIIDQTLPMGFLVYNILSHHQSPESLDWRLPT